MRELRIELVPRPLWGMSLAKRLPRARWNTVRRWAIKRAGDACQMCETPAPPSGLICHEVWEYDDATCVQRLVDVEVHCRTCDAVTHMGRTSNLGDEYLVAALDHLSEHNGWTTERAGKYAEQEFSRWAERSERSWTQDLGWYQRWAADQP